MALERLDFHAGDSEAPLLIVKFPTRIASAWVSIPAFQITYYKPLNMTFCACFCLNKYAMI